MDFYLSNVLKSVHINRNHKDKMGVFFFFFMILYIQKQYTQFARNSSSCFGIYDVVLWVQRSNIHELFSPWSWLLSASCWLCVRGEKNPQQVMLPQCEFHLIKKSLRDEDKRLSINKNSSSSSSSLVYGSCVKFRDLRETFPKGNIFNEPVVILSMENPEWQWGKPVSARLNRNCLLFTSI